MYRRFYAAILLALITSGNLFADSLTYTPPPLPIVLVHGAVSTEKDMEPTIYFIRKYMGDDVYIKNIVPPHGFISSNSNIYTLIESMRDQVINDPKLQNGFNVIGHSQGALVARYYVERYNNPQVFTYISWGGAQQGVFGIPGTFDNYLKWLDSFEEQAHKLFYSWFFQKFVSLASYWHDTLHYEKYIKKSCFLPYLNNEIDHQHAALFKENICKLTNMVLVQSSNDDIVEPLISCHFGFYKKGSKTDIEKIFDTEIYKNDTLGLKTLHETGRLHLRFAKCAHFLYQEDEENFVNNTLPFLKMVPAA